ncbi:MAG: cytochrome c-type biogenesis protein [Rhizobiaceae bacterium]
MQVLRILAASFFIFALSNTAIAVQPDEVLDDPALEERARNLSAELRCLVCQNQSIDDSDAQLAKDLRVLVRERLVAGDTDNEVMDYVVGRYGEFVLLKPRFSIRNMLLWFTPILVLLLGAIAFLSVSRRGSTQAETGSNTLSAEEKERLTKILDERD